MHGKMCDPYISQQQNHRIRSVALATGRGWEASIISLTKFSPCKKKHKNV